MTTPTKTTRPDVTESYLNADTMTGARICYENQEANPDRPGHVILCYVGVGAPAVTRYATLEAARGGWRAHRIRLHKDGFRRTGDNGPLAFDPSEAEESCPRHEAEAKAAYDFGMNDATVITYRCGCATTFGSDSCGGGATLHRNYSDAAGHARFLVAKAKTW